MELLHEISYSLFLKYYGNRDQVEISSESGKPKAQTQYPQNDTITEWLSLEEASEGQFVQPPC